MDTFKEFNSYIQQSIISNWDKDALTDYKGITLQYHDVARKIEKLHILFANSGVNKGDKIALCGRNSSCWAVAFLATLTYGAIAVPILHEFNTEQIHNIVNHSEAKLLFVGDVVSTMIDPDKMPAVEGIIYIPDYSLVISRSEKLTYAREHLNEMFGNKYPKYFRKQHIDYYKNTDPEEIAIINYTSGTTGFSKGVMIPYRALWSNLDFVLTELGPKLQAGGNMLCILPMAHMYGLMIEFLFNFAMGNRLFFLTRLPSPSLIAEALLEVKPMILISVPLIIEKIVRKKIFPIVQSSKVKLMLSMPVVGKHVKERICQMVKNKFGGNVYEIIIGGAGMNPEIEEFFVSIGFPLTMGYGTTETAPLISYCDYTEFEVGTCGKSVAHMQIKIASNDPENVPGEILTKGLNVMKGYYKNEEATKAVIDDDGWFHTGDLATMDSDGQLFIRGRIKNMLLGSNGQNIYPEEIEFKLNNMAMVNESLIVQDGDRLIGLVHPDHEEAQQLGFSENDLQAVMEQNRIELNEKLPAFCKISEIKLQDEEFEKTPKKSIKRYLYQKTYECV
jgi:long-chain acyl-CoA synthetase